MQYDGNVYTAKEDRTGNIIIVRHHDGANCFLQGDDATDLRTQLEALDVISHPSGPFQTYAQHLDAVLDAYESVIR
jgi:hypothetical protein